MSDEEILPCVICHQEHEQMLMLVCMHDPCINCASIHYCTSTSPTSPSPKIFVCAKCGEITDLDSTSVVQLQKVYAQIKGKKKYDYRRGHGHGSILDTSEKHEHQSSASSRATYKDPQLVPTPLHSHAYQNPPHIPTNKSSQSYTPISQPSYQTSSYNMINVKKSLEPFYMCQSHPEEELTYFCFTCTAPICPQCAIHGPHRQHEVQTTRKSIKKIKQNLVKSQQTLVNQISTNNSIIQNYKNRIKDFGTDVKKQKESIKEYFVKLRTILGHKESQFLRAIEGCYEGNVDVVKNESESYVKVLDENAKAKRSVQQTLRKDDLSILQEYSTIEKQTIISIQSSRNRKHSQEPEGLKQINYELFKDQFQQLTGIIGALKLSVVGKNRRAMSKNRVRE